jgi:putative SOS response-associated peptidase YedK
MSCGDRGSRVIFDAMCGLYSFRRSPEEARSLFNYLEQPNFPPRDYVTPGSPIAIVREGFQDGVKGRHFALVRWGFVPSWSKDMKTMINARSETVFEKPSFRNAIRRRRCLIPTDGFYEWEGDVPGKKKPYHIHKPGHALFAFAGIWENWMSADGSEIETAAIVTADANLEISRIHDRSPVLIEPEDFDRWLDPDIEEPTKLTDLMHPPANETFELTPTIIVRNAPPKKEVAKPDSGQMNLF